jgi:predicted kinase
VTIKLQLRGMSRLCLRMMVVMADASSLFLITGSMAVGKSSVAQGLAERLPKSVHLRGDVYRRMIVNGRAEMGFELSEEALEQLELRYRLALSTARFYLEAGFTVVYQDIIIGKALPQVVRTLADHPLYVIVLCPKADVVAARDAGRAKTGYATSSSVAAFDHVLHAETPRLGLWLDTSALTVEQTVDTILANLDKAKLR